MQRSLLGIGTSSLRVSKRAQVCTFKRFRRHFHDNNPLPPEYEWRSRFPYTAVAVRDRISVRNPDTASILAEGFLTKKSIAAGKNKVIIEAYPGKRVYGECYIVTEVYRSWCAVKSVIASKRRRGQETDHLGTLERLPSLGQGKVRATLTITACHLIIK